MNKLVILFIVFLVFGGCTTLTKRNVRNDNNTTNIDTSNGIISFKLGRTTTCRYYESISDENFLVQGHIFVGEMDSVIAGFSEKIFIKNKDTTLYFLTNKGQLIQYIYPIRLGSICIIELGYDMYENYTPSFIVSGIKTGRAYHFIDRYHLVHSKDTFDIRDSLFWQIQ